MNPNKSQKIIDVTGIELLPGNPESCPGNGKTDPMQCCCDECEFFLDCFKEWDEFVYEKK